MKKIFIIMIGLLFTASAVFASPNTKVDFDTLNNTDSQILFDLDSVSAITLSNDEMVATEGEFVPLVYWAYTGYRGWRTIRSGYRVLSTAWRWGPYGLVGSNVSGWR